jgi:hypothetical protein
MLRLFTIENLYEHYKISKMIQEEQFRLSQKEFKKVNFFSKKNVNLLKKEYKMKDPDEKDVWVLN